MSSKKTTILSPNMIFLLAVEAIFGYLAVRTFRYSRVAAMMPGLIIGFILVVTTILILREIWLYKKKAGGVAEKAEEASAAETEPESSSPDPKIARMRELEIIGWLAGLAVAIYLLGFLVAIPVFLFLFLRIRFSLKWLTTAAIVVGTEVGVYLIFIVWLQTMLYGGLLSKLFIPQ